MKGSASVWGSLVVLAVGCGADPGPGGGTAAGTGQSGGEAGGGGAGGAVTPPPELGELVINEVMSQNDGAWIDELGEADDWLELVNRSDGPLQLSDYFIQDAESERVPLPSRQLAAGASLVLWADSDPEQGQLHLPFKLASGGDQLVLTDSAGSEVDRVDVPALEQNQVLARFPSGQGWMSACRYATPRGTNGEVCAPAQLRPLLDDVEYEPFALDPGFPAAPAALVVSELSLRPGPGQQTYVELENRGVSAVALDDFSLELSPHSPSQGWPEASDGQAVPLPVGMSLSPGQRLSVAVPPAAVAPLSADPAFEGVITLFDGDDEAVGRVDFMRWPLGATLARNPEVSGLLRYCTNQTPGAPNTCDVLPSRDVGERVRYLRTPGDYEALAEGATLLGIQSAKFVVDLSAPGLVHLLSAARWPLHYTFVRERVYEEPELDRCDPDQNDEFYAGWSDFSNREYDSIDNRRFHLGTLSYHGGAGVSAVEYTFGDIITGEQMRDAFVAVMAHTDQPRRWAIRPQDDEQVLKLRDIEGTAPLMGRNAPFAGVTYQPLTEGEAYGTLRFVPVGELLTASLGPTVIVVTDDVPNDIPFVGGLITEAFQTPLAHVNVLSQNRGTPNAGLSGARQRLAEYLDQLVRVVVAPGGIEVTLADPAEAAAFWDTRLPAGEPISPRIDESVRGVQDLSLHSLDSLPAIGAKASQMAELLDLSESQNCPLGADAFIVPDAPFAVPLVHYREHFAASGAEARLAQLQGQAGFGTDAALRAEGLAQVRQLMLDHPVDAVLLAAVEAAVEQRFGEARVRFRSSSNTEDLPNFNGAGLYTSISGEVNNEGRLIEDALRTVWASLWNARAYDERAYARIESGSLGMGVLVHPASLSERGNGVGVSRNVLDPIRGDIHYVNVQMGEASVTNPAPAVSTEQMVYRWYRQPPVIYQSKSSLLDALPEPPETVLTQNEVVQVACALDNVHRRFRPLLDPDDENPWFAMEIEFKIIGPERQLLLKQARPHSFGQPEIIADCREL